MAGSTGGGRGCCSPEGIRKRRLNTKRYSRSNRGGCETLLIGAIAIVGWVALTLIAGAFARPVARPVARPGMVWVERGRRRGWVVKK